MIKFSCKSGFSWDKTKDKLEKMNQAVYDMDLNAFGRAGVEALKRATPVDTGTTAASWSYKIKTTKKGKTLAFYNSNCTDYGMSVALLIQYGHSANGYYVQGIDFVNPAIKPVWNAIGLAAERAVK